MAQEALECHTLLQKRGFEYVTNTKMITILLKELENPVATPLELENPDNWLIASLTFSLPLSLSLPLSSFPYLSECTTI